MAVFWGISANTLTICRITIAPVTARMPPVIDTASSTDQTCGTPQRRTMRTTGLSRKVNRPARAMGTRTGRPHHNATTTTKAVTVPDRRMMARCQVGSECSRAREALFMAHSAKPGGEFGPTVDWWEATDRTRYGDGAVPYQMV